MALQESGEMYLESIYMLSKKNESVLSIDVCEYMGYSKPSVSRAVKILKENNYITVERDGNLRLTEKGLSVAESMYQRHTILTKFLTSLGVDEQTAANDACKIEHVISEESFEAIRKRGDFK
ncbi:MAG: metal-dependent transcriptional regulator [Clostridia bacterium]|nr:metal-dependent transcriptional regulator [Clostridia bacterium]